MSSGSVVFVDSLRCPSCGMVTSGYARVMDDGRGSAACPRCGAVIHHDIPPGAVQQLPPQGFVEPGRTVNRASTYSWLYARSKERPRFCLGEVLRIAYSPTSALSRVYTCSDLRHALILVLVFSVISGAFGVIVTESMAEVLGYSASDAIGIALEGVSGIIVALLSFLVFGVVAAKTAGVVFGGRGDRGSTLTLVAYCYPWFVVLTLVLLAVFSVGFEGLNLDRVQHWSDEEAERAIVFGAALLAVVIVGFTWLLWLVGRAVGMANDIRAGSSILCIVLAGAAAGIVSLVAGMFVRLPIGIGL